MKPAVTTLRDLCQIKHGGTPSKANNGFWKGEIPWISPKDMKSSLLVDASDYISPEAVENSATSIVPKDSILIVVRSGILVHTLPVAQAGRPLAFNQDIKALIPDRDKIDPDYLYWFLRGSAQTVLSRGVKKGATVHSVQSGFIENLQVPIVARAEQRRTIDILSRAEGIVRLRREAQKKAGEIIPALFLEMFGDPATNPKGWPVDEIGNLGRVQLGRQRAPKYQTGFHTKPYMRVANVFEDRIDISDVLSMDFDEKDFAQYQLSYGDILLNEGQSTEQVGRPAMWRNEINNCCFQNTLVRFQPTSEMMNSEFSLAALLHYYRSGVLSQISSKTSNVAHLGAGRFSKVTLYCPPLELQNDFARKFESVRSLREQELAASQKAEATFEALLAKAFLTQ